MKKNFYIFLIVAVFAVLISGCQPSLRFVTRNSTSQKETTEKPSLTIEEAIKGEKLTPLKNTILSEAEKWLGTPYCYGGSSHDCTDCSGFVLNIFLAAGIKLPRTAEQQFFYGKDINDSDKDTGDLVFFRDKSRISHVGIYLGNNEFIHASTSNGVVVQSIDDDYYKNHYAGTRRIIQ